MPAVGMIVEVEEVVVAVEVL